MFYVMLIFLMFSNNLHVTSNGEKMEEDSNEKNDLTIEAEEFINEIKEKRHFRPTLTNKLQIFERKKILDETKKALEDDPSFFISSSKD